MSFKRSGELFGKPRVVKFRARSSRRRNASVYYQAVAEAIDRCSPMPFTDSMGGAVAGRTFQVRFHRLTQTKTGGAHMADNENKLTLETTKGNVVIELRPDLAPKHVERIKTLVKEGFYDGIVFHRVIDGFMAQTGCPHGTGTGGSNYPNLPAEFSAEPHVRGTVSAARAQNPNSANSQFFICFDDARFLDKQYSVWGKVIEGMDNVDKIKRGEPVQNPGQDREGDDQRLRRNAPLREAEADQRRRRHHHRERGEQDRCAPRRPRYRAPFRQARAAPPSRRSATCRTRPFRSSGFPGAAPAPAAP